MKNKNGYPELIKPQEVLDLSHTFTTQSVHMAKDIADLFEKEEGRSYVAIDDWKFYCMISAIWEAGRINGIREERQFNVLKQKKNH